ncbi:MAG: hypothetical protein KC423_14255 [Anaerolineales bacterium]|nr:hypothetical protein [Anaerolineales bacterium]
MDSKRLMRWAGVGATAVLSGVGSHWLASPRQTERPFPTIDDFVLEQFRPARGLVNPHMQTMLANFVRPDAGVTFRRQRVELPDGDFIDLDFADVDGATWAQLGDEAPIVLALHGLEGSAKRPYMVMLYRELAQRGVRAVGMNFRSCSGEMNRTARLYNGGDTTDLAYIFHWLRRQYSDVAWGLAGFSLGANVLLKFLGEKGREVERAAKTAVAVSPPFDMVAGARVLDFGSGRPYRAYLMRQLQEKLVQKEIVVADKIDYEAARAARTFHEFDDACTAPLGGFRDAHEYYSYSGSGQFLADIHVPTLLLRALDDPFFANDIPQQTIAQNPYLYPGFVAHGGHVAFVEGVGQFGFWAERQAARFLAHHLMRDEG